MDSSSQPDVDQGMAIRPIEPPWFRPLFEKLIQADLAEQLPGESSIPAIKLSDDDVRRLIGHASVLGTSPVSADQSIAYEVATRLIELFGSRSATVRTVAMQMGVEAGRDLGFVGLVARPFVGLRSIRPSQSRSGEAPVPARQSKPLK